MDLISVVLPAPLWPMLGVIVPVDSVITLLYFLVKGCSTREQPFGAGRGEVEKPQTQCVAAGAAAGGTEQNRWLWNITMLVSFFHLSIGSELEGAFSRVIAQNPFHLKR